MASPVRDYDEKKVASVYDGAAASGDVEPGTVLPTYDGNGQGDFAEKKDLRQGLKQRHIQMIALAGTIGTGLFLSSGKAIGNGGPLGAFLGYLFTGLLCCAVVMSVAEMSTLIPLSGGVIRHAEYFVDPALSFANGWNQVYADVVSIPAELCAAAVLFEFWNIGVNVGVWITVLGICLFATNIFFVRVYGEIEFAFASLKIMLIVAVNIMALVITCGGAPDHTAIGFTYWRDPGAFVQYLGYSGSLGRFMGFWTTFENALYAYSGIENITLAAAETQNPRRNIPRAARRILARVVLFYVLTIFLVTLTIRSDDPKLFSLSGSAQSPFVLAARSAGIKVMPSIINAVVLTSAWSSGNSSMLGGSRILYGLAREGHAPAVFKRTSRFGIPWVAVSLFGASMALAYMSLGAGASTAFEWLQDLVAVAALCNFMVICGTYLRFYYGMKHQGISRDELPWKAPLQPYMAWVALVLFGVILLTGGYVTFIHGRWDTETFFSSYFNIPFLFVLYFGYKIVKKSKIVSLEEMPIQQYIDIAKANPEPPEPPKKGLRKLNFLWE
ncbi:putative general amino acid permease [Xylariaceae sp. FL0804]|nr:putative general amino acid permease [Xylariaceae sp. FL0804]